MMKITIHFLTILLTMAVCHIAQAQKLKISYADTNLEWTGKAAINSYSLSGNLKIKSAEIEIDQDTIKSMTILVDMNSLDHKNKDLKNHLRNKDFFEVKKYNNAMFTLQKPTKILDHRAHLLGIMKIKNIEREETFEVLVNQDENKINIIFDIQLDRTKYGVTFNSPSFFKKLKDQAIADLFRLKGTLTFH